MRKLRRVAVTALLAACAWNMTAFAAKMDKAAPSGVTLEEDGTVTWSAPDWDGVDRFEIQIVKGEDAASAKNYKSKKINYADETSAEVSLSSRGYYRAKVRAYDVEGDYTEWSELSNMVTVTSDDLSSGSGPVVNSGGGMGGPGMPAGSQAPSASGVPGSSGGPGVQTPANNGGVTSGYGWQQDSRGRWYRRVNGTYPAGQWEKIDGTYYHFDAQGYMQTGWVWEPANSSWYLCLPDGKLATGWNNVNERWYYLDPASGVMYASGLHLIDGKYYCMDEKGARIENAWSGGYYYGADGARVG